MRLVEAESKGGPKLAQLQAGGPLSAINTTVMPINPATMMMAVALFAMSGSWAI